VGTLLAILIFFRGDIKAMITECLAFLAKTMWSRKPARQPLHTMSSQSSEGQQLPHAALALWALVAIIPTALIGISLNRFFQEMFGSTMVVGIMLMATGAIVGATRLIPDQAIKKSSIGLVTALAVGLAQGAAITPGISRSGATITCGLFCGLDRDLAGRFSFLMSIPAIIGALVMQFDMTEIGHIGYIPLLAGTAVSFMTGFLALKITMSYVRKGKLYYFSPYCFLVGIVTIFSS
jgi:undecaprenyl-diphosphatase